jgi:uncharacterized protein (TIGR03083 family)
MTPDHGRHSGRHVDDLATQWGVAEVLTALSESDAVAPPPTLRSSLLDRVSASPRSTRESASPVELFAGRVHAMRLLLHSLDADDWTKLAKPYQWSVHGLIAHLLVIERYTGAKFGLQAITDNPFDSDSDSDDHLAMGSGRIASELEGSPIDTFGRWSAAVQRIVEHVTSERFEPSASVVLHGWPFSQSSSLVARAFELWTHHEDISRAVGLPLELPPPFELRTMSTFSVASLEFLLPIAEPARPMRPTRVVLTGLGGGTFDIGGRGERAATVVTDVVDYCRVVARRVEPDELVTTVEGDHDLVGALLKGSRAFAV